MEHIGTATSLVGAGINAVQRAQEKDRQERIDQYNKELNDRNFHAQQLQNSPSYQMQRMKDAGWNPLAQGIEPQLQSPQAGDTLSPQPMETSSVGNAMIQAGQTYVDEKIRSEEIALQKQALELKDKELDLQRQTMIFEQIKTKIEHLVNQWNTGSLKHNEANKQALKAFIDKSGFVAGFDDDGNIYLQGVADIEQVWRNIKLMSAQENLVNEQVNTQKALTKKARGEAEIWFERGKVAHDWVSYEMSEMAEKVANAIAYGENMTQDTRVKRLAGDYNEIINDLTDIQSKVYQLGADAIPAHLRTKIISCIKRDPTVFHDFLYTYAENTQMSEKELKEWNLWYQKMVKSNEWINTLGNGADVGKTVVDMITSFKKLPTINPPAPTRNPVGFGRP